MKSSTRHYLSIAMGVLVLILLVIATLSTPREFQNLAPALLFTFLIVFTNSFGVPLAGGTVSLLPMTTVSAFLALGVVPAGWAAYLGALITQLVRIGYSERLGLVKSKFNRVAAAVALANAAIQTLSIMAGGLVFVWFGKTPPVTNIAIGDIFPLVTLGATYMLVNLFLAGIYIAARGKHVLKAYLGSLPDLLIYEVGPLFFAPLMALIYTVLGWGWFLIFSLAIILASLIAWNLGLISQRLERRVQELDSLQAVGQALSASLVLEDILMAVYLQVAKLMPADNFYVALYYPEIDEVTFPLAVEKQTFVNWKSRRAGKGLTEYILQTKKPLLIKSKVKTKLEQLEIEQVGTPAASWLGVPLLSGDKALGVIAIQSIDHDIQFKESQQEILVTIAAQAAIAIQNARLYEQTDEALRRRVQELNSILRTTTEGILLFDLDWNVLAANRALADFLGLTQIEFSGGHLQSVRLDQDRSLLSLIGYTEESLKDECRKLERGGILEQKKVIKVLGLVERHLERKLTPVREPAGEISGWLLVFRDLTEEMELARLREDMTHMLVHDLRTPLTSLKGSIWVLKQNLAEMDDPASQEVLDMSERSADRMIDMVNSILDIAKLEIGQMPLHLETVTIRYLFEDVFSRLSTLAEDANIVMEMELDPLLPALRLDADHFRRVLTNLVDNAIKFTPDGGKVRLWGKMEDGSVLLGVTDTGPGIPKKAQAKLFHKFQQVVSTEGRRKGTGLGLAYCKLVVDAHDGEIGVESIQGQGATFYIRLPFENE